MVCPLVLLELVNKLLFVRTLLFLLRNLVPLERVALGWGLLVSHQIGIVPMFETILTVFLLAATGCLGCDAILELLVMVISSHAPVLRLESLIRIGNDQLVVILLHRYER